MKYAFFIIAFALIFCMMGYVLMRGWQALPAKHNLRLIYSCLFSGLFIILLAGLFLQNTFAPAVIKAMTFAGYTFLIIAIYLFISFLLVDIVRLSNHFFHFAPVGMQSFRLWAMAGSLGIIAIALIIGNYKFNHPEVVQLNLTTEMPLQNKEVRIVAASDIHLDNSIDKKKLKEYVKLINAQSPDIVFLLGDVTDMSVSTLMEQNMQVELQSIHAPLGVYAISGNHEYYSGKPQNIAKYLRSSGITVLHDSVCLVDNSFYLVGRDDKTNLKRKPLAELVMGLDEKLPKILLDHQPFNLQEAEQNGIDLQLSGHTHNGQFFPGNLIVNAIFEDGYGYLRKGRTQYYVSSGLGIWGPQYRIGTQSELVVINLKY